MRSAVFNLSLNETTIFLHFWQINAIKSIGICNCISEVQLQSLEILSLNRNEITPLQHPNPSYKIKLEYYFLPPGAQGDKSHAIVSIFLRLNEIFVQLQQ